MHALDALMQLEMRAQAFVELTMGSLDQQMVVDGTEHGCEGEYVGWSELASAQVTSSL